MLRCKLYVLLSPYGGMVRMRRLVTFYYILQVGMATSIPPHNLGEVVDALIALIHNPNASVSLLNTFFVFPLYVRHYTGNKSWIPIETMLKFFNTRYQNEAINFKGRGLLIGFSSCRFVNGFVDVRRSSCWFSPTPELVIRSRDFVNVDFSCYKRLAFIFPFASLGIM